VKLLAAHAVRKSVAKARVIKEVGFMGYLLAVAGHILLIVPRRGEGQGSLLASSGD